MLVNSEILPLGLGLGFGSPEVARTPIFLSVVALGQVSNISKKQAVIWNTFSRVSRQSWCTLRKKREKIPCCANSLKSGPEVGSMAFLVFFKLYGKVLKHIQSRSQFIKYSQRYWPSKLVYFKKKVKVFAMFEGLFGGHRKWPDHTSWGLWTGLDKV